MTATHLAACLGLSALALAAGAERAGGGPPPASLALTATPARLQLTAGAHASVEVTNPGRGPAVVSAVPAGYAVDALGRPRVAPPLPGVRLRVAPARLVVAAGGRATVTVSALAARGARPGDHTALVLLSTEPPQAGSLPARVRIGVVVLVRVRGRVVRRLELGGLTVRRRGRARLLELALADRGNVDEWIGSRRLTIALVRGRRVLARLHPVPRRLLARTRGLVGARVPPGPTGALRAVVRLRRPQPGVAELRRSYPLRL